MQFVRNLSRIKREHDKIKDALKEAEENGYGVVYPTQEEYALEKPQLMKKGNNYGVRFKASATSYHIVKVDIYGAVNSVIGTKKQSEDFIDDTLRMREVEEENVWETNIFGKSLRELVGEELSSKSSSMPIELRKKMRRTLAKIVNDGKNNFICFLF